MNKTFKLDVFNDAYNKVINFIHDNKITLKDCSFRLLESEKGVSMICRDGLSGKAFGIGFKQ